MGDRRRPGRAAIVVAVVVAIIAGGLGIFAATRGGGSHTSSAPAHDAPDAMTVNGVVAPVGVDPDGVSFAWHVTDARRGAYETGYRVVVSRNASTKPGTSDVVWDETVRSAQQAFVPYRGPRLASDTQYWWTVQTTTTTSSDANAVAGGEGLTVGSFAPAQPFVTGMRDRDWKAQWVRPGPADPGAEEYTYLRKVVRLDSSPIVRARRLTSRLRTSTSSSSMARRSRRARRSRIPTRRTTKAPM